MYQLILDGHYSIFLLIVVALIVSLTFHEFGHAAMAKFYGDNTAQQQGRLTLNPIAHIDPMGLLMVVILGFGYAKPVPTNPRNYTSGWAQLWIAAAGPLMNLLIAFITVNIFMLAIQGQWAWAQGEGAQYFFVYLATINLILMLFNLIPLGPLDGHYIAPYLLPAGLRHPYVLFNQRYGSMLFLGLIVLSILGIPVFSYVWQLGQFLLPLLVIV